MNARKGTTRHVLLTTPNSWRTFILECLTSVILVFFTLSPNCEAQCSTPTVSLEASTNSQLLLPPNYPSWYADDTACSWLITSPVETGRIRLRVVEDHFSCCCQNDYLLIKDGSNPSARPIGILCSELNPVTLTSSGPALYGEFRSDGDGWTGLGYTVQVDYFDSSISCPSEWIGRDSYCYRLYDDALSWQQAASRCGYDGGFLTSIEDEEENNFIVASFRNLTSLAWIGIDAAGNWLDGTSQPYNNFTNDTSPSYMDCALIDLGDDGQWRVSDCVHQQLPFICKKTQDGSGGRYWTDIYAVSAKEDESFHPLSLIVGGFLIIAVGAVYCCFTRSNRFDRNGRDSCCAQFLSYLCGGIFACARVVGRAIDACWSCTQTACTNSNCCPRRANQNDGTETRGAPTDTPQTYESRASFEEVQTPTENLASSGSNGQTNGVSAPPSYGDVISEVPPPSYNEALDAAYDGNTRNTTETRGGPAEISLDVDRSLAAPSYASHVVCL